MGEKKWKKKTNFIIKGQKVSFSKKWANFQIKPPLRRPNNLNWSSFLCAIYIAPRPIHSMKIRLPVLPTIIHSFKDLKTLAEMPNLLKEKKKK